MTSGTEFAKMVRKYFHIGAQTRTHRGGRNMKDEILEAIATSNNYPGYYNEDQTKLFRAAYPIFNAYLKHVKGHRIDGMTAYEIEMMSPYKFAGFLGEMIDAGITNSFEGELFFQNMRKVLVAA
jgi:hypothetical protein